MKNKKAPVEIVWKDSFNLFDWTLTWGWLEALVFPQAYQSSLFFKKCNVVCFIQQDFKGMENVSIIQLERDYSWRLSPHLFFPFYIFFL